ncbi:OLC1v1035890C1 [Oldenlandia corymbosa var. corymbosa]|uniref:OLC1v1035890C1 n=1 Tax=Oldenlandia corymbosa var. corymbosa TaxID=529605 RepID=A0AAV1CU31_OLDCO|nr:OLC1v1035890C1 [Oldenlandia corymbosa var. corymbosa]
MRNFISFLQQLYQNFLSFWPLRPPNWIKIPLICCFRYIFRSINQFSIELIYFLSVSFIGFVLLKAIKPRTDFQNPSDLDLFFTSVSASTVSSMSTVEMELFSNSQLVVIIILMFIGGEVFTSMVGLHIRAYKLSKSWRSGTRVGSVSTLENSSASTPSAFMNSPINNNQFELHIIPVTRRDTNVSLDSVDYHMRTDSIKFLGYVVLGYLTFFHVLGVTSVFAYINIISSARNVLKSKGINGFTFAVFTVVSTFASCGFLPTNENMVVFGKNSGLLLILIPQVLLGNTLFPSCLRFTLWILGKFVIKSNMESQYLLNNTEQIGYFHLLPKAHSIYLIATVFGFICIQCILIWSMEWNSGALRGLSTYQKLVGVLFQSTNSRHTGETILDISTLSQAILVLLVIMMLVFSPFLPFSFSNKFHHSISAYCTPIK